MKQITTILTLFIVLTVGAFGQKTQTAGAEVIVYLKDGSAITGNLIEWIYGDKVTIVSEGVELTFPANEVERLIDQSKKIKKRTAIVHKNEGIYYKAQAQLMTGNDGSRAHHRVGWGITASAGYQWNQYLMTGFGLGYREFIWDSAEVMLPVYAELGGYFANTTVRPFYNVQMGYSFAFEDEDFGLVEAKGGLFIYPSVGISVGRQRVKTTFDLGYNFQDAQFTYGNNFDDRIRSTQDVTYRRLSFRIGINF